MSSIFSILLVVILNLMPAGTKSFTIEMAAVGTQPAETVRFNIEADGWHADKLGRHSAVKDLGVFTVKGTELIAKRDGKEFSQDLGKLLGIDQQTDWQRLKELKFGQVPMRIQRQPDGIDFVLVGQDADGREMQRTFTARWAAAGQ